MFDLIDRDILREDSTALPIGEVVVKPLSAAHLHKRPLGKRGQLSLESSKISSLSVVFFDNEAFEHSHSSVHALQIHANH